MLDFSRRRSAMPAACLIAGLLAWQAGHASATTFSTDFSGDTPGQQPSVTSLAELGNFATFGGPNLDQDLLGGTPNEGEVFFIARGAYYFSGNRAYGLDGAGRSDITFTPGTVREVNLQVRGSSAGNTIGLAFGDLAAGSTLGNADVTVLIYSDQGLQLTVDNVSNTGFQGIALDITNPAFDGDSITRISLINEGPANSIADLGFLSINTVPEPGSIALLGMGGLALMRRRRHAAGQ